MQSDEIRLRFLRFFEQKPHGGHKIIPSSSLVPENDQSVLFTTAGMQQFKSYYTGEKNALQDFGVKNVVSIQKCIRTSDIDQVGDDTHLTFFEMLGNFSFGGYWKKEAIEYGHEFITKELGLKIDYISVFEGDSETPADEQSRQIWKSVDKNLKIKNHNRADNFWGPTGEEGPCGPTTEIYVNGVEIWNIVFNEYYKTKEGKYETLKTKGVDTGMGLERLLVQVQNRSNVFETDLFNNEKTKEERIVADHIRTSIFMIADGVIPSNTARGYILRRLLRRSVRYADILNIDNVATGQLAHTFIDKYRNAYPNLLDNIELIKGAILTEENKFRKTLKQGLKEFEKGADAFSLFTSYGFPPELSLELAKEKGRTVDLADFERKMAEHQKLSRISSADMFKEDSSN